MTSQGKTLMRTTRTITTLLVSCLIVAAGATTASAGKYRHLACPGTLATGAAGWRAVVTGSPLLLHASTDCDQGGWMHADVGTTDGAGYSIGSGQWAGWRYRAPDGTQITSFTGSLAGWMQPNNEYYEGAIIIRDEGVDGTVDLQWFENRLGSNQLLNNAATPFNFGYGGLATSTISVAAVCATNSPSYACTIWQPVWMAFKNAAVGLQDNQGPQAGGVTGTLVADSTIAGNKTLSVPLTDQGGGVRQLAIRADGVEISRTQLAGGSCVPVAPDNAHGEGYSAAVPCPTSLTAAVTVDTKKIADGTHTITATAIDAAGNTSTVYEADKTIANVKPTNINAPSFKDPVAASKPSPGSLIDTLRGDWAGPNLTYGQQWQRCDADGSTCVDIPGATGTRYTPTAADAGFRLKLTVTAVNLAGSLSKTTTLTGVVAAPEQSPTAVAQNPSTLIKTPDLGGAGGGGEGRGNLNGTITGSDTGSCNKDQFQLRATRYKGRIVHLRYGRGVAIRVKLTCATGGYAVSGAKLQTATLIPGQSQAVGGELITDTNGEAILHAPKGPSRGITIGYRNYTRDDLTRAELRLRVAVRGKVTLTVRQGLNGRATFGGRVIGGYIPARGVTVQLQFLDPRDGWRPVKNMKTDSRGRYRYAYQFKQPVSFKFRAVVAPGQVDYPFMPAHSPTRIGHG